MCSRPIFRLRDARAALDLIVNKSSIVGARLSVCSLRTQTNTGDDDKRAKLFLKARMHLEKLLLSSCPNGAARKLSPPSLVHLFHTVKSRRVPAQRKPRKLSASKSSYPRPSKLSAEGPCPRPQRKWFCPAGAAKSFPSLTRPISMPASFLYFPTYDGVWRVNLGGAGPLRSQHVCNRSFLIVFER